MTSGKKRGFCGASFFGPAFFAVLALFLPSCQDHHFVPIENAGSIKMPVPDKAGEEQPGKMMELAHERLTRKEKEPVAGPAILIANGVLDLGAEQKQRDFTGYTIYVIAWPKDGKGTPIAVARYSAGKFPMDFKLDTNDLMMSQVPAPDTSVNIEARLDKEKDPSIKSAGDLVGTTPGPVPVGSSGLKISIDRAR